MLNTSSKYVLEIACFNLKSCTLAQKNGADRVEFCADYPVGGITPTQNDILEARKILHIPLHVIIRPRSGNFVYSEKEVEIMKNDILFCKQHSIDGVVFGVLHSNHTININTNKELVELAKPMSVTFHRAIDECYDIEKAMDEIIMLGFNKVLTSGSKQNASEGVAQLKQIHEKFGMKINIIPAGGIRSENINFILKEIKTQEIHTSALTSNQSLVDECEIKKLKEYIQLF